MNQNQNESTEPINTTSSQDSVNSTSQDPKELHIFNKDEFELLLIKYLVENLQGYFYLISKHKKNTELVCNLGRSNFITIFIPYNPLYEDYCELKENNHWIYAQERANEISSIQNVEPPDISFIYLADELIETIIKKYTDTYIRKVKPLPQTVHDRMIKKIATL